MRRRIFAVLLLIVMLCGCGKKEILTGEDGEAITEGGSIRIYSYQYDTLNPIFTNNNANLNMLKLIFEPLIWCDDTLTPNSVLADSWDVSSDGLMWTVHVRSGVKFHDGSDLTAEDVVKSLNAARLEQSAYSTALSKVWQITQEDSYVHIRLNEPDWGFVNNLNVLIVKADMAYAKEDFIPVGTGPYIFGSSAGRELTLSSNKSWWGENTPYIDTVSVQLLPDKNTATFSFDAQYIDVVNTDVFTAGKYASNEDCSIVYYNNMNLTMLGLNNAREKLSKPETRRAIACAINRNELCEQVIYSKCVPAKSMISPNWYMYDETVEYDEYSVRDAMMLLDDAGYNKNNPLSFDILVCEDNETKVAIANYISQALLQAGINTTVTKADWDTYTSRISAKNFDAFVGEFSLLGDADLSFLMSSYAINNGKNYFSCSSGEIDNALSDIKRALTKDDAMTAYSELQSAYAREMPFVSLFFGKSALLMNNKISGDINPLDDNVYFNINKWYVREKE